MIEKIASNKVTKDLSGSINSRISPWLARLIYPLGSYALIPNFFRKIKITGQENIPRQNPVIVAPTHRSRWDALIVPYSVGRMVSGRDLRFMVSSNEVQGIQGWFIRRLGGFPVDTERTGIGSIRHSIELLKEDEMLVIFPEGGIVRDLAEGEQLKYDYEIKSENCQVYPLKRGVARIALETQESSQSEVRILPISVRYSQAYPTWGSEVWVNIGSPIVVRDYLNGSLRKSSQKLTKALQEELQKLYEIKQS